MTHRWTLKCLKCCREWTLEKPLTERRLKELLAITHHCHHGCYFPGGLLHNITWRKVFEENQP